MFIFLFVFQIRKKERKSGDAVVTDSQPAITVFKAMQIRERENELKRDGKEGKKKKKDKKKRNLRNRNVIKIKVRIKESGKKNKGYCSSSSSISDLNLRRGYRHSLSDQKTKKETEEQVSSPFFLKAEISFYIYIQLLVDLIYP